MPITKEQAVSANEFHKGQCLITHGPRGGIREEIEVWRRNGATQVWVTRPDEFRVPVVYGLKGYSQLTHREAEDFHTSRDCPLEGVEYRGYEGDGYLVEVNKRGGGTLGRRYGDGEKWDVRVLDRKGACILEDALSTGSPKTHREVAALALEFAVGES